MMPPATQFAEVMSRYRCSGMAARVVLYEASRNSAAEYWAARVWWMLRAFGFDQAAILNGGLHQWTMGRPPGFNRAVFLSSRPLQALVRARNSSPTNARCWRLSGTAALASSTR